MKTLFKNQMPTVRGGQDKRAPLTNQRQSVMNLFRFLCRICFAALLINNSLASAQEHYPRGFPNDPGFFPIGVWLQSPSSAPRYKAIGINTFIALWNGPTEAQLAELAKNGMFAVAAQNDVALASVNRGVIKGWLHEDEPDNAQPIGLGLYGSCVPATEVVRRTQEMKSRDPTRPVMINFGQGVANEFWRGRGPCTSDQEYYSIAAQGADILSFDIYPVGSGTPQVKGKLEYVARGVTNLVNRAVNDQKVWTVLETTGAVTPAQVRSEVWMAIIHGAKGIVYFVHEFAPTFREDGIFRHPDVIQEVARTNALIKSLAIRLNSPNLAEKLIVQSTTPIATMVKQYENTIYVFAVAMNDSVSKPRFTINGFDGTKAIVIGEDRSVTITHGVFEDPFEGYGVHIYEIHFERSR
jgi:hypothetical protein